MNTNTVNPIQGNEFVNNQSKNNLAEVLDIPDNSESKELRDEIIASHYSSLPPIPHKREALTYESFVSSNWNNLYPRKIAENCITLGLESTDKDINYFWTSNRHFFEELIKNWSATGLLELIVREIPFGIEHLEIYFRGIDIGREIQKRKVNEILHKIKHQLEILESMKIQVARNHGEQTARVSQALKLADQFTRTSGKVTDEVEKLSARLGSVGSHQHSFSRKRTNDSIFSGTSNSLNSSHGAIHENTSQIPIKKKKLDMLTYENYINSHWNGVYEEILKTCVSLGINSNNEEIHSFWENYQYFIQEVMKLDNVNSLLRTIVDEIPHGTKHLKVFFRGIEIGKDVESPNALKAVGKGASDFAKAVEVQLSWCQETVSQTLEQSKQITRASKEKVECDRRKGKMEAMVVEIETRFPETQITPSFVEFAKTSAPVVSLMNFSEKKMNGPGCFEHVEYDLTVVFNSQYLVSVITSNAELMELKELIGCLLPATQVILNKNVKDLENLSRCSPGWIAKCKTKQDGFKFTNLVGPIKLRTYQWRLKKNIDTVLLSD